VLELSLALLFALSYVTLGFSLALVVFLLALAILAFVVVYDIRHTVVPLEGSVTLFFLSVVFLFVRAPSGTALGEALIIAGTIGIGFLALHVFSGGKAMGLGDAPIAFSLSLLVAPYAVPGLLFSFWIGALFGIAILFMRRGGPKMGIEVPFVPFLAAGFLLAYFTGWNPLSLNLL
jgi:prepilin signal peptidase PulO-like enzyme (type II secretory pathway)